MYTFILVFFKTLWLNFLVGPNILPSSFLIDDALIFNWQVELKKEEVLFIYFEIGFLLELYKLFGKKAWVRIYYPKVHILERK